MQTARNVKRLFNKITENRPVMQYNPYHWPNSDKFLITFSNYKMCNEEKTLKEKRVRYCTRNDNF